MIIDNLKNKNDPQNEDDLINDDNLKNEYNLKIEDNLTKTISKWRQPQKWIQPKKKGHKQIFLLPSVSGCWKHNKMGSENILEGGLKIDIQCFTETIVLL